MSNKVSLHICLNNCRDAGERPIFLNVGGWATLFCRKVPYLVIFWNPFLFCRALVYLLIVWLKSNIGAFRLLSESSRFFHRGLVLNTRPHCWLTSKYEVIVLCTSHLLDIMREFLYVNQHKQIMTSSKQTKQKPQYTTALAAGGCC